MKTLIAVVFVFCFYTAYGCVPAMIGAGAYHSAKTKEARQTFQSNFAKTNAEREAQKLPPLDWCGEAYHFDRKYAMTDRNCKKRVVAYEKGNNDALGKPMLQSDIDALPEPPKPSRSK